MKLLIGCFLIFGTPQIFAGILSDSDSTKTAIVEISDLKKKWGNFLKYPYISGNTYNSVDTCVSGNCLDGEGVLLAGFKKFVCQFKDGKPIGEGLIVFRSDFKHLAVLEGKFKGWDVTSGKLYLEGYRNSSESQYIEKPLVFEGEIKISNGSFTNYDVRFYDISVTMITKDINNNPTIIDYNGSFLDKEEVEVSYSHIAYDLGKKVFNSYQYTNLEITPIESVGINSKQNILGKDTVLFKVRDTFLNQDIANVKVWRTVSKSDRGYGFMYDYFVFNNHDTPSNTVFKPLSIPWIERISTNYQFGTLVLKLTKVSEEVKQFTHTTYTDTYAGNEFIGRDVYGNAEFEHVYKREKGTTTSERVYYNLKIDCYCDNQFIVSLNARQEKFPFLQGESLTNSIFPFYINEVKFDNTGESKEYLMKMLIRRACNYKTKEQSIISKNASK